MAKGLAGIIKGAGAVSAVVLVCKLLGFVEKLVVGKYYQTSYEADVYLGAFVFLIVFQEFARGIAQPFLPVMSELKEKVGEAEAWKLFSILVNVVLVPFLVLSLLVILYAGPLAAWFYRNDASPKAAVVYDPAAGTLAAYPVRGELRLVKKGPPVNFKTNTAVLIRFEKNQAGKIVPHGTVKPNEENLPPAKLFQRAAARPGVFAAADVSARQCGGLTKTLQKPDADKPLSKEKFSAMTAPVTLAMKSSLLAKLLKIMFLGATFLGLSAFTYLLLNSEKRFFAPALGDLVFKVLGLVGLIALMKWVGVVGGGIGVAVGGVGYLTVNIAALWRKRALYRPTLELSYKPLTNTLKLMAPLVFYMIFYLGRQILDQVFALPIEGGVSSLQYSYKLIEFPHRTLLEPFAIAIFPTLSLLAVADKDAEFADLLQLALRAVCLLFVPAATCLFVMREHVVTMLWPGFSDHSHFFTTVPLMLYAFAMIPLALDIVLTKALIAKKDTWSPSLLELVAAAVHLGVILGLRNYPGAFGGNFEQFLAEYPHAPIALGFTLSRFAKTILLYFVALRRVRGLKFSGDLLFGLKIITAFLAMLAAGVFLRNLAAAKVHAGLQGGRIKNAEVVFGASVAAVVVFYGLTVVLRVTELRDFFTLFKERRKNKTTARA